MKESKKLMLQFLGISFGIFLFIGTISSILWGSMVIIFSLVIWAIISTVTVVKAWTQVPHKWVYVIEKFGEYYTMMGPGLRFVFPWFNFYKVEHRVYTGEMKMMLFEDEVDDEEDYKEGIIDFKDESAKVEAFFFFKVTDDSEKEIKKAAYETNEPIEYVKVIAESVLRGFLAHYTLFEANELKGFIDLNEVFLMKGPEDIKEVTNDDNWRNTKHGRKLLSWGFTPISFSIRDIKIPNRVIEKKSDLMKAKNDSKIAEFKKEVKIKLSEGDAEALKNMSNSRANEVQMLMKETEMTVQEAILFITDRRKYEAMAKAGNVTWIEGLDDKIKKGASFGIGFDSVDNKNKK